MEDYYVYCVRILKISEEIFWNADFSFLMGVITDAAAYDAWRNYIEMKELERK